ncbi:unnamed protein product [Owenia fusiformis]|uniref:Uncharacterized protein n=1 Tax=Owenia fusiformis TaxID=6347 RepID=A0A8S4PLD3_OWEFU|nr:unnamed protein product [Owenia fusiformis]
MAFHFLFCHFLFNFHSTLRGIFGSGKVKVEKDDEPNEPTEGSVTCMSGSATKVKCKHSENTDDSSPHSFIVLEHKSENNAEVSPMTVLNELHGAMATPLLQLSQMIERIYTENTRLVTENKDLRRQMDLMNKKLEHLEGENKDLKKRSNSNEKQTWWKSESQQPSSYRTSGVDRTGNSSNTSAVLGNRPFWAKSTPPKETVRFSVITSTEQLYELVQRVLAEVQGHLPHNVDVKMVTTENTTRPTLLFCLKGSRLGTDVDQAVKLVKDHSAVMLIVVHHQATHVASPTPSQQILPESTRSRFQCMTDLLFWSNGGYYTCRTNENAILDITNYLKPK